MRIGNWGVFWGATSKEMQWHEIYAFGKIITEKVWFVRDVKPIRFPIVQPCNPPSSTKPLPTYLSTLGSGFPKLGPIRISLFLLTVQYETRLNIRTLCRKTHCRAPPQLASLKLPHQSKIPTNLALLDNVFI